MIPELFEGYLIFTETYLDKPLPECGILLVMLLELLEFGACSVVESPVFFGFRVKFHIEGDKRVDSAFFDLFARTPESECTYKLADCVPQSPRWFIPMQLYPEN